MAGDMAYQLSYPQEISEIIGTTPSPFLVLERLPIEIRVGSLPPASPLSPSISFPPSLTPPQPIVVVRPPPALTPVPSLPSQTPPPLPPPALPPAVPIVPSTLPTSPLPPVQPVSVPPVVSPPPSLPPSLPPVPGCYVLVFGQLYNMQPILEKDVILTADGVTVKRRHQSPKDIVCGNATSPVDNTASYVAKHFDRHGCFPRMSPYYAGPAPIPPDRTPICQDT